MEGEIATCSASLMRALARGDAPAASALYADDARLLTSAPDLIQGRAGIEAYWRTGIALGLSTLALERHALDTLADRVLDVGRYTFRFGHEVRASVVEQGTYVALHRRIEDGSWRRWLDVFDPGEADAGALSDLAGRTQRRGGIER